MNMVKKENNVIWKRKNTYINSNVAHLNTSIKWLLFNFNVVVVFFLQSFIKIEIQNNLIKMLI